MRLALLGNQASCTHQTSATGPSGRKVRNATKESVYDNAPNDGTGEIEVFTPALSAPTIEEGFEKDLGLGIKAVLAEQTVVGREGKDDLSGVSDKVSVGLLVLDRTHETENANLAVIRIESGRDGVVAKHRQMIRTIPCWHLHDQPPVYPLVTHQDTNSENDISTL